MPEWAATLMWIAGVIGAVGVIGRAVQIGVRWVRRTWRKLDRLADELLGSPATDDAPARPSLMQRMIAVETRVARIEHGTAEVRAELKPNGGSSIKDQVTRIEQAIRDDTA